MIKAIIFDLDGTLLDTLEDIAISCNHVLEHFGTAPLEVKEYKELLGQGASKLVQDLLPTLSKQEHENALVVFEKHYTKQFTKHTKMYENINKMLTFFQVRGIKMAILSNKPNSFTKKCVTKYLNKWDFSAVYGIREGVPRKPDPAGAYEILKELQVEPSECLFVGDMNIDMMTANSAGIASIGVLWGFSDEENLASHGADFIVNNPEDIIHLFEIINKKEK